MSLTVVQLSHVIQIMAFYLPGWIKSWLMDYLQSRSLKMVMTYTYFRQTVLSTFNINLHPEEGRARPLSFPYCQKTSALCTTVFGTPYHTYFLHMLGKFQKQVIKGQVTRSRQVTSPNNKFECLSQPHRLNDWLP